MQMQKQKRGQLTLSRPTSWLRIALSPPCRRSAMRSGLRPLPGCSRAIPPAAWRMFSSLAVGRYMPPLLS
ncbi:dihydrofolate reductase [Histoplasma capsulatum G186AR]|uniref:Dihydrofolate reductase n=1 Tax=Ajellomyces capsulatus TaxID=5037 RepID=A0A8H7Z7Z6_AJECA|nr:dihydrofolate reductase [Histoplasma capsulatum]QSS69810.1 dihydrofolate reductase [Histoplasma capsulatum G186AR]